MLSRETVARYIEINKRRFMTGIESCSSGGQAPHSAGCKVRNRKTRESFSLRSETNGAHAGVQWPKN